MSRAGEIPKGQGRFDIAMAARYGRVLEVIDARGRTIGVRRIRLSEHVRVIELLDSETDLVPLLCAAAVTSIEDGSRISAYGPNITEHRLWHLVSRLGDDGIAAVTYAIWQHAAAKDHDGPAAPLQWLFYPFSLGSCSVLPAQLQAPILPMMRMPAIRECFRVADVAPSFHKSRD